MKKIAFLALIIAVFAAILPAQEGNQRGTSRRPLARETVTISGAMVVANGRPALKSGDDTYLVGGISSLIGFVDGLKEGAQVTVEGTVLTLPWQNSLKYLQASKLTFGGKSYDLSPSLGMGMMGMGMWNSTPNGQFSLPNPPRAPMMNQTPNAPRTPAPFWNQRTPRRR